MQGEALTLLGSTVMVLLAASKWQAEIEEQKQERARLKPEDVEHKRKETNISKKTVMEVCSFGINVILTIALFSIQFWYQLQIDGKAEGLPIERQCLQATQGRGHDLDALGNEKYYLPISFALWLVALFGSLLCLRLRIRAAGPAPGPGSTASRSALYQAARTLAVVFGSTVLVLLCLMFYDTWMDMKMVFGRAFLSTESAWNFGQFLALFTWFPPLITLVQDYSSTSL